MFDITFVSNSNGLLDPWSGGGVKETLAPTLVSIIIPEGAHHLDLRSSNPDDPQSVIKARQQEKSIIQGWIKQYHNRDDHLKVTAIVYIIMGDIYNISYLSIVP